MVSSARDRGRHLVLGPREFRIHRDTHPTYTFPIPLPTDRGLTTAERYAALAAVHDLCCDGQEKISPWAKPGTCAYATGREEARYCMYHSLLERAETLTEANLPALKALLDETEPEFADVMARLTNNDDQESGGHFDVLTDTEFASVFAAVAAEAHEILDQPGVRSRFQEHRRRQPARRNWNFPPPGPGSLTEKYIWVGTVHDLCCCPNEPVFPNDALHPLVPASARLFLWGSGKVQAEHNVPVLKGFLADIRMDLSSQDRRPPSADNQQAPQQHGVQSVAPAAQAGTGTTETDDRLAPSRIKAKAAQESAAPVETVQKPQPPADDLPDETGLVRDPKDRKAYLPASDVIKSQWPVPPLRGVSNKWKELGRILAVSPAMRRWRPKGCRHKLCVHLGDWLEYVNTEKKRLAAGLATVAKQGHWMCMKCNKVFVDRPGEAKCPSCGAENISPVVPRCGK